MLTAILALSLFSAPGLADEGDPDVTPSGYHNVDLVERDRYKMNDMRDYRNVLVLSPMLAPFGLKATWYRAVGDRYSVFGKLGLGGFADGEYRTQRVDMRIGLNHHPVGNGMHGFYVGPRASRLTFREGRVGSMREELSVTSVGVAFGYRWIWDPGLSLATGFGGSLAVFGADGASEVSSMLPIVEFNLGWAF